MKDLPRDEVKAGGAFTAQLTSRVAVPIPPRTEVLQTTMF
jgi:hypothetical protein